jgi:hypothetical protein
MEPLTHGDSVKYEFVNNADHLRISRKRFYAQYKVIRYATSIKILLAIALSLVMVLSVDLHNYDWSVAGFCIVALWLFLFYSLRPNGLSHRSRLPRSWRLSPYFNIKATVCHDETVFYSFDSTAEVNMSWSLICKARSFADGLLIFMGPKQVLWLPDANVTSGTPESARAFVRNRVTNFAVVDFPKALRARK